MTPGHSVCPLCGNQEIKPIMICRDNLTGGELFEIYLCTVCRLEFLKEYPDEKTIEKYYISPEYISHNDDKKSFTAKIYYAVRKFMLSRKRSLVRKVTGLKRGSILDIGSGTGHFAGFMKKSGWDCEGVEKSLKAAQYSVTGNNIRVYQPEEILSLPGNSFDCITMWHVLEHLYNPEETLSQVKRLLKPGAPAVIALPNNISFDSIHYRNHWAARDVPRHIWHFNPVSFIYLAAKSGFDIREMKRLPFDVFYISVLSEKSRGSRFPFLAGMIKGFVFFILSLFDVTRSSSVVYIIRPKSS